MNGIAVMIISAAALAGGYLLYGKWLEKSWGVQPSRENRRQKSRLGNLSGIGTALGSQFASAAGLSMWAAGSLWTFGWLPVLLGLLAGGIFFGAAQSYAALCVTVNRETPGNWRDASEELSGAGKGTPEEQGALTEESHLEEAGGFRARKQPEMPGKNGNPKEAESGERAGQAGWFWRTLACLLVWVFCVLTAAALGGTAARTFQGFLPGESGELLRDSANGTAAAACLILLVENAGLGAVLRYRKLGGPVKAAAALLMIAAAVWLGREFPLYLSQPVWQAGIFLYVLISCLMPAWVQIRSGGYVSVWLAALMILTASAGIFLANPSPDLPAVRYASGESGQLLATLAQIAVCGAVTGLDALNVSGSTSWLVKRNSHVRPVAMGTALLKCFLGVLVVIAAASLDSSEAAAMGLDTTLQLFAGAAADLVSRTGLPYDPVFTLLQLAGGCFLLAAISGAIRAGSRAFAVWLRRDVSVHWPSLTLRERLLGGTATVLPAFLAVWMGLDTETLAQGAGILLAAVILGGCGGYFRRTGKRSLPALLPAGILAVFSAGWLGMYLWEHVQVFLRGEGSGEYAVCSCLALLFLMGGILLAARGIAVRRQPRG